MSEIGLSHTINCKLTIERSSLVILFDDGDDKKAMIA